MGDQVDQPALGAAGHQVIDDVKDAGPAPGSHAGHLRLPGPDHVVETLPGQGPAEMSFDETGPPEPEADQPAREKLEIGLVWEKKDRPKLLDAKASLLERRPEPRARKGLVVRALCCGGSPANQSAEGPRKPEARFPEQDRSPVRGGNEQRAAGLQDPVHLLDCAPRSADVLQDLATGYPLEGIIGEGQILPVGGQSEDVGDVVFALSASQAGQMGQRDVDATEPESRMTLSDVKEQEA